MATIVNMGTLLGEAAETAQVHGLAPQAKEWLLRRVYRDSAKRFDLQSAFHSSGVADNWMLALQWDWIESLPPGEPGRMRVVHENSERHVARAVERGEPLLWCRPLPELQLVADWLACLPTDYPEMLRKLDRVSWDEAVALTERWHARLAKRMSRPATAAKLAEGTRAVLELPYGWRWVRLETERALDREGDAMGHCVGNGAYDGFASSSPPDGIYSLRDAVGMPHVTAQVRQRKIRQAQGKGNAAPSGHATRIEALVKGLGVKVGDEGLPGSFGLADVGGRLISIPDALALMVAGQAEGDVDLRGADLEGLPEGAIVRRDLNLSFCRSLASLPADLTVGGSLRLRGCWSLTGFPEGLVVRGNLDLYNCTSLVELPAGLTVEGWLDLGECTALTRLPDGLTVRGHLFLNGCPSLTGLPDDLTVGGEILGADRLCQRQVIGM